LCAGDPYEAERYASSEAIDSKRRLSKDNALAARLAWQGLEHLDAPAPSGESATLGERLADSAVPDDLVEPSDRERERRAAIREAVHATLGRLGAQSAYVLRATYGITPVPFFGSTGDGDEELAAALGSTPAKIRVVRSKAKARFRDLYLAGAAELVALPAAA
jgi:DNA-directed RNA polymerase sigma subunit (sigma70/sigma32)